MCVCRLLGRARAGTGCDVMLVQRDLVSVCVGSLI